MNKGDNAFPLYYIGHSKDENVRYKASSGGIGTVFIKYLLLHGFGTALTFVFDKMSCAYIPKFVYKFEDYNICGSIYQDIDIYSFVKKNVDKIHSGIVITCMPCQVKAIRSFLNKNGINCFIISFACSGQTLLEGTWLYYRFLKISRSEILKMQYRGNGWPSGIQIELSNGKKIFKENYHYPWSLIHGSKLFRPQRCFKCQEVISYNSDVSLADPWLEEYSDTDKIGNTLFIINTPLAFELLSLLDEMNWIYLKRSTKEDYLLSQHPNVIAKKNVASKYKYVSLLSRICNCKLYREVASLSPITLKLHIKFMHLLNRLL